MIVDKNENVLLVLVVATAKSKKSVCACVGGVCVRPAQPLAFTMN